MDSPSTDDAGRDAAPSHGGNGHERLDLRKVGMWMIGFGAVAQIAGMIADAVQQAGDSTLAQREGIFDLSSFPHVIFFAGICLAVLGLVLVLFGPAFDE